MNLTKWICHYKTEKQGNRIVLYSTKSYSSNNLKAALENSDKLGGEIDTLVEKTIS